MSAHTSIMSLWSLQSNSFRQKSLKQPLVSGLHAIPPSVSSLLNSHQPLLLPKITQERHSNPRLTTAQLGRKRGIKTHTKKETHHIVEGGGRRAFILLHAWRYLLMILASKEPHTLMQQAKTGKRKVCLCAHTFWMHCYCEDGIHFWCHSVSDLTTSSIKTLTLSRYRSIN